MNKSCVVYIRELWTTSLNSEISWYFSDFYIVCLFFFSCTACSIFIINNCKSPVWALIKLRWSVPVAQVCCALKFRRIHDSRNAPVSANCYLLVRSVNSGTLPRALRHTVRSRRDVILWSGCSFFSVCCNYSKVRRLTVCRAFSVHKMYSYKLIL